MKIQASGGPTDACRRRRVGSSGPFLPSRERLGGECEEGGIRKDQDQEPASVSNSQWSPQVVSQQRRAPGVPSLASPLPELSLP